MFPSKIPSSFIRKSFFICCCWSGNTAGYWIFDRISLGLYVYLPYYSFEFKKWLDVSLLMLMARCIHSITFFYVIEVQNIFSPAMLMVLCCVWNRGILSAIDVVGNNSIAGVRIVPTYILYWILFVVKYILYWILTNSKESSSLLNYWAVHDMEFHEWYCFTHYCISEPWSYYFFPNCRSSTSLDLDYSVWKH